MNVASKPSRSSILDALLAAGIVDEAAARRAEQIAQNTGESVVAVLHQLALADDARVVEILASHFELARFAETDLPKAPVDVPGLSAAFLRRCRALPLGWLAAAKPELRFGEAGRENPPSPGSSPGFGATSRILVGVIDPERADGLAAISFAAGRSAEPRLMSLSEWRSAFDALYGAEEAQAEEPTNLVALWTDDSLRVRDQADAAPAVRLVDTLLDRALEENASDIHIEPLPDRVRVRFRIDGVLKIVREEPAHLAQPIAARIKILADMDVADRRRPQDGRTSLAAKGRPVDVRISSVPSSYGETVALRLLRRDPALLDLAALGFSPPLIALFEHVLQLRRGLFLVTGPTGSGKTTTLYAMLERLRGAALKILSIEDPIEYFFSDITQTQVNEDAGLNFATALRSFLRQDPDVILVGEIRDSETAKIAIQAALTGHLVLATLHTADAPSAVPRLVDMGVDRYLVAATLAGAASQRLLRRLCAACRARRAATESERAMLAEHVGTPRVLALHEPVGCDQCRKSGYRGRIAVGEGFRVNDALREAALDPSGAALIAALKQSTYAPLMREAARLVVEGEASLADFRALSVS